LGIRSEGLDRKKGVFMRRQTSLTLAIAFVLSAGLYANIHAADVVINELHFDPEDKTVFAEFIELHNAGEEEVDLSGWFFSNGVDFTFPEGSKIEAGGYLVIGEDPETLASHFAVEALGPYEGRLSNEGERVVLRDPFGNIEDEVRYDVDFPWSIAAKGGGSSLELIHPSLDNNLGGSWRASGLFERPFRERVWLLDEQAEGWSYRKGLSEPSDPADAWKEADFVEDDSWEIGQTSVGFGDDDDNTILDDMRGNYTSVYLRRKMNVALDADGNLPRKLTLGLFVDDGAFIFINGFEVIGFNTRADGRAFDSRARSGREARWTDVEIPNAANFLKEGENQIAVHALNATTTSADFSFDLRIFVPGTEDEDPNALEPPSPGGPNSVLSDNAPPQIRQVAHFPEAPKSDENIVITARVTDPDGVASVNVSVQDVLPGQYVPALLPHPQSTLLSRPNTDRQVNPAYVDPENWTSFAMRDDGRGDDAVANDGTFTATLEPRGHRTLVRYRIDATDTKKLRVDVPYRDDPSRNFALFVYDGLPPYKTTRLTVNREGVGFEYSPEVLSKVPVYHLLTRAPDMTHCISYSGNQIPKSNEPARDKFNWNGTFVYEGKVYDHVTYRLRQANDRYGGSGKRSMRIRFRKGNYLRVRDQYGERFPTRWRTLNTGKMFDNKDVGNFGLTETMNADLWNMVGAPAPWFFTFHFRVIDGAEEAPDNVSGQYSGDFWGMRVGIEDYDPRFLEAHQMADGNLYKLKDGQFNGNDLRRNQGRFAITTDRDFQNIRSQLRPTRPNDWLDAHVNYPVAYRYHAVVEGIRHYDFRPADSHSKNRAWYFEPDYRGSDYGRLWTLPWDSDASWGPNWNSGVDYTKDAIMRGGGAKAPYRQAYRNYLREFRDLVWTEEVIHTMIDDLAEFVEELSEADRDRYRSGPAQTGRQDFGPMRSKVADMKRFAFVSWSGSTGPSVPQGGRARHLDNLARLENDSTRIPRKPSLESLAPEGFPIDALTIRSSPFDDPQDDSQFTAIAWRIGEITDPDRPWSATERRVYEVPALWEHEAENEDIVDTITVPRSVVAPGHRYRVRVRHRDEEMRWSHWSDPIEFVAGGSLESTGAFTSLRVTEIMYHPDADSGFEFLELTNIGAETIELSQVRFTAGVDFDFGTSNVTSLEPGQFVVIVNNSRVFELRYGTEGILVAGQYTGQLDNGGERLELTVGNDTQILELTYDDLWFRQTDGFGLSLVLIDPTTPVDELSDPEKWRQSNRFWGSPGSDDSSEPTAGLQRPGDFTQDSNVNVSDAVALLRFLVGGVLIRLPCGEDTESVSNQLVLDINGDRRLDITDPIHLLNFLFRRGVAPAQGTDCVRIEGCANSCN